MKAQAYKAGEKIIIDIRSSKGKDLPIMDELDKRLKDKIMKSCWKWGNEKPFLRLEI